MSHPILKGFLMNVVYTVLFAFAIGFFMKRTGAAALTYLVLGSFVFTFQSVLLVTEWASGSEAAFGPFPDADSERVIGYGVVNLLITTVGVGLVLLGAKVGAKRAAKKSVVSVD